MQSWEGRPAGELPGFIPPIGYQDAKLGRHDEERSGRSQGGRMAARPLCVVLVAGASLLLTAAGCTSHGSAPSSQPTPTTFTSCGNARTAANVPVKVKVSGKSVTCATAFAIERGYARAIRLGLAPGNGGGGPVKVRGWTCQGFATPVLLQTGKASKCVRDGTEILEILRTQA
jgi:hypothetical protein